jgi:hypothetical protein
MFENFDISGWTLEAERSAGISALILWDYCATVVDPSDATALTAAITANEASIVCIINGEKPVGSDITRDISLSCGVKTIITGRDVTVNFDALWTRANLDSWQLINGTNKLKFALVTCNAEGKGDLVYYDTRTTLSVDDEITGTAQDGSILVKGVLTTKRKKDALNGKPYAISEGLAALITCEEADCD